MRVTFGLNGIATTLDIEPHRLLVHVLREDLGLTGTHIGCETSSCGACTVTLDGRAVKSCTMLAVQTDRREVTTIEGLADDGRLHPVQAAFIDRHALQCGFCTPGMAMSAVALLRDDPEPTESAIRAAIAGNQCRCTGYQSIIDAIRRTAILADVGGGP